jgi:hypothetical protein
MAILALLVAIISLRFLAVPFGIWPPIDAGVRRAIAPIPFAALTHFVIAPIALLVGPLQLHAGFRARHRQAHRALGLIYIAACVAGGIGGLVMAFHASGGPVAGLGFGILAVAWIGTTLGAWLAVLQRRLALHQLLMTLSYAMTFGAVTLRLQMPLGFALGFTSYPQMSVWLAYTSWLPNVLAVGLYWLLAQRVRGRPGTMTAQRQAPAARRDRRLSHAGHRDVRSHRDTAAS